MLLHFFAHCCYPAQSHAKVCNRLAEPRGDTRSVGAFPLSLKAMPNQTVPHWFCISITTFITQSFAKSRPTWNISSVGPKQPWPISKQVAGMSHWLQATHNNPPFSPSNMCVARLNSCSFWLNLCGLKFSFSPASMFLFPVICFKSTNKKITGSPILKNL